MIGLVQSKYTLSDPSVYNLENYTRISHSSSHNHGKKFSIHFGNTSVDLGYEGSDLTAEHVKDLSAFIFKLSNIHKNSHILYTDEEFFSEFRKYLEE